jgi:hypothetical protein
MSKSSQRDQDKRSAANSSDDDVDNIQSGQQGTGGLDSGHETGSSSRFAVPLSFAGDDDSSPGRALDETSKDDGGLETSWRPRVSDRTGNMGAETPGNPGELMSQPTGDGNYLREGDSDTPIADDVDPDSDGLS